MAVRNDSTVTLYLGFRCQLAVLAVAPVAHDDAAEEHTLNAVAVRLGVLLGAGVGGVTGEVDALAVRDGVAAGEGAVEALLDDEWDDLGGRAVVQPALLEFSVVVDAAGGVGRRVAQLH